MAEFRDTDLSGSVFHVVSLRDADIREVDLSGARIRGAYAERLEISGDLRVLEVNGVDVVPLVEAELNRRYPDRVKMFPADAAGFRVAWAALEALWEQTVDRARGLPPELLHRRVDGEWSFIETLRHLVFATDAWISRAYLGEPAPFHPLGLPHTEMPANPAVPRDLAARPSLDEILAVRAERTATVRRVVTELTDERLAGETTPVTAPGYPEPEAFAVRCCLQAIVIEEWEHRLFAERDLDKLNRGGAAAD